MKGSALNPRATLPKIVLDVDKERWFSERVRLKERKENSRDERVAGRKVEE